MIEDPVNTDGDDTDRRAPDIHPDSVVILPGGVSVSYQESEVAALAAVLATLGVRPEERVLIVMPDGSGFAEAVIGTIRQAAVPLPVNPAVRAGVLASVVAETGARLAVVAEGSRVLSGLRAERAVPVHGRPGIWATVLLLC